MQKNALPEVEKYMKQGRKRRIWQKVVSVMACLVVFCTTYALILPAITQENEATCTVQEHTHSESCYTQNTTSKLVCTKAEKVKHEHTDECYQIVETAAPAAITEAADSVADTASAEGSSSQTEENTAGQSEESEESEASEAASEDSVPEESFSDESVSANSAVEDESSLDEPEDSTAGTATEVFVEKVLICTKEEEVVHEHTEICYEQIEEEPILSCELTEHVHGLACYADLTADVETADVWEQTFANAELTGVWTEDVITIAKTQFGYIESTKNYIVEIKEEADGTIKEITRGYTRYGAWYGDAYGDWCAMFVSFCLDYADVEGMPLEAYCPTWIEKLSAEDVNLYHTTGSYVPEVGNLVFFDWDADGESDHVGIVSAVNSDTEDGVMQIETIEGNSNNRVAAQTYSLADETIMGFAELPYRLSEEELEAVQKVINMIDDMPSADEIDVKLAEYEEAEDYDGEEAYYMEVCEKVAMTYSAYAKLSDEQKALVTNADKLLELEYIWSAMPLIDEITSNKPTTVAAASTSEFVELNLYDYGSNINEKYNSNNKYPGFQWNGGAYLKSTYDRHEIDYIDFGNSMITDLTYGSSGSGSNLGYSSNRKIVGNKGGAINALDVSDYGVTNRPIGMSLNSSITDNSNDVLQRTLGDDGYPALTDKTSLKYLFTNNTYATKKNTVSIDGLFQQDAVTGEYFYNSRENHAQYSSNKFTLYNQIITPNFITYPFGNFLPLNDITNGSNATQVSKIERVGGGSSSKPGYVQQVINDLIYASDYSSNPTKVQLLEMLVKYRDDLKSISTTGGTAWDTWSAKDAIVDYFTTGDNGDDLADNPSNDTSLINDALLNKMYNIDWDVKTNFFFGMEMNMNFMQSKGGMTGNDTNKDGESDYPMKFYFTGDDDVWVYIDGVLFLDLSGIHRHVGGEIDFVNGKVHYYYLDTANTGDVSTTPYQTYSFAEILSAAGKSTDGLNSNGTFADYTTHQFKFYYMERGSGSSVCRLNFNFPLLKQNSISVSKVVDSDVEVFGDPEYKFQVLKADSTGNKTDDLFIAASTSFTIYDENDIPVGIGKTDANGVFTLKAGQKAEFEGINENAGKYYVRELLDGTILEQYGNITVSGESTTKSNDITIGSDTFTGMDSPVKDMSDGATAFRFTNNVVEDELGKLTIEKYVDPKYSDSIPDTKFKFKVLLDDVLLPVGTKYTVGSGTRVVSEAGYVEIAADEKAVISNILAGTKFVVTEDSSEDYTANYIVKVTDIKDVESTTNASGILTVQADVTVEINNSEIGDAIDIPVQKAMLNCDGQSREYSFEIQQVVSETNLTTIGNGTTITLQYPDINSSKFKLAYVPDDISETGKTQSFYYKISEVEDAVETEIRYDKAYYVILIEVVKNGTNSATIVNANLTKIWRIDEGDNREEVTSSFINGEGNIGPLVFTNTATRNLVLKKSVIGTQEDQDTSFNFTVSLVSSGEAEMPKTVAAVLIHADGSTEDKTYQIDENGQFEVSVKHGESLEIQKIPYGFSWKVEEDVSGAYDVSYQIGSATKVNETAVAGTLEEKTEITFVNSKLYELPESGGSGTTLYSMAGLMLVLCSTAFLLYRYQKHRREAN